ncbi:hypothetical protein SPRG_05199 [Saprolegnia parasitica CBS 223.65]|uniref:RBR-type E3 ubiquitin transferase n=1 Tax=Saprolegnia parasitica (strain CBS 223.65) TaxID=695850 RepID=A0A067CLB6_SAPPC|nr:hypothetical protein SPRG_05199 [Saprolegnia parasitica CBS 223.65]KDO30010.1 hypothetical protein SPRG_05199 [Saprolegnia parasitica CBS 223.65]|eukprot:XP_012199193.1 hypothetical protein SPRG_05199 [Saprolegnia parasitica CBS 223.65]
MDWATLSLVVELALADARDVGVETIAPASDAEMAAVTQHIAQLGVLLHTVDVMVGTDLNAGVHGDQVHDEAVGLAHRLTSLRTLLQARLDVGVACCVCLHVQPSAFTAPCNHEHCLPCLRALIVSATDDVARLPLACCQQLWDLDAIARTEALAHDAMQRLRDRTEEATADRPVYCPNTACPVTFVSARHIDGNESSVVCPGCRRRICTLCSARMHEGTCDDAADASLNALGAREGWQRCPHCRRMVELVDGCNHMTCMCRTEFCYVCAARWKTCGCPHWHENRWQAVARPQHAGPQAYGQQRVAAGARHPRGAIRQWLDNLHLG